MKKWHTVVATVEFWHDFETADEAEALKQMDSLMWVVRDQLERISGGLSMSVKGMVITPAPEGPIEVRVVLAGRK